MKPPRCIVCGDANSDTTLVEFADYRALPEGMTGHPQGLAWFCSRHAPVVTRLRHLSLADAVARIGRHRWWWPFR